MTFPLISVGGRASAPSYFDDDYATLPITSVASWPSALYDSASDKTYEAWTAEDGASYARIREYDHATGLFSDPVTIDQFDIFDDAHGWPVLVLLSDGRLAAFYGSHDTTQQWAISGQSGGEPDITSWTVQTSITGTHSYPHPVNIPSGGGAGTVYLFTQDGSADFTFQKAAYTSGGALSFGTRTTMVSWTGRVYMSECRKDSSDNIEFMFSYANAGDTSRQHHYYGKIITATDALENLSGGTSTAFGSLPINQATADASYREVTSTNESDVGSWCRDAAGDLHHVYMEDTASPYDLFHRVWNGSSWSSAQLVSTVIAQASGGFKEDVCVAPGASGSVDVWYPQGDTGAWSFRGGDTMTRRNRSSGGTWGSAEDVESVGSLAWGHPTSILNGHADYRARHTEVTQGTSSVLRVKARRAAYGDGGHLQQPALTNSFWPDVVEQIRYVGSNGSTPTDLDVSISSLPLTWAGDADIQSNLLSLDGTGDYVGIGTTGVKENRRVTFGGPFFIFLSRIKVANASIGQSLWGRHNTGGGGQRSILIWYTGHESPKAVKFLLSFDGSTDNALNYDITLDTSTEYDLVASRDASDVVRLHFGVSGGALPMRDSDTLAGALYSSNTQVLHGARNAGGASLLNGTLGGSRVIAADMGVTDSDYTPEAEDDWTTD